MKPHYLAAALAFMCSSTWANNTAPVNTPLTSGSPPAATARTLASPPAPAPAVSRYIVRFSDALPSAQPDLRDPRVRERVKFGNLRPEVLGHIQRLEKAHGFKARHGYSHALKGFSAELTKAQLDKLRKDPQVRSIEPDAVMRAASQVTPYGATNVGAAASPAALAGDSLENGVNLNSVRVFVVDSGVATHPDLNLLERVNFVGDGIEGDCNGHGTHVAGTVGARDNATSVVGVAPGVGLSALKVLDCSGMGFASSLINAFDYATSSALANPSIRYVANASLGFPTGTVISSLDAAVQGAVKAGIFVTVAAGNSGDNTCSTSLVRLSSGSSTAPTGVMAVGAVDSAGREASFSSFGGCLATWAPGVSVLSTLASGGTGSMNGTSMATPHVAGAAAVLRAAEPLLTPLEADTRLKVLARNLSTLSKDGRRITHLDIATVGASAVPPIAPVAIANVLTPTVDFGVVRLRARAVRKIASFSNAGTAPMTLTGLSGLPVGVQVVGSNCSTVAPGASCSITLEMSTRQRTSFSVTVTTVGAQQNASFVVRGAVQ